ncbi:MAG: hypothetical protein ABEH83_08020 [Halobacterium sp.]
MNFETLTLLAVSTAFLSMTSATVAFMASPSNWWISALLGAAAVALLVFVAFKARDRATYV